MHSLILFLIISQLLNRIKWNHSFRVKHMKIANYPWKLTKNIDLQLFLYLYFSLNLASLSIYFTKSDKLNDCLVLLVKKEGYVRNEENLRPESWCLLDLLVWKVSNIVKQCNSSNILRNSQWSIFIHHN